MRQHGPRGAFDAFLLLGALTGTLAVAVPAAAHDLGVARVELHEAAAEAGRYTVSVRLPAVLEPALLSLPERCAAGEPSVYRRGATQRLVFDLRCTGEPLGAGDVLALPWQRDGAFVAAHWADGTSAGRFVEGDGGRVEIPVALLRAERRSLAATAGHYAVLGVEHILLGWDHLAFVLGLCLIARGWHLVTLVSAFTVGHSLTLAAAVLGWARVPVPPMEACIALSIAFVAREALQQAKGERGLPTCHGAGLTAAFGLLHGLGFASALAESGIQASERLPGLIAFNLGVELGQLTFVLAVVVIARLGQRLRLPSASLTPALARALGVLALFWTIERVAGFVG